MPSISLQEFAVELEKLLPQLERQLLEGLDFAEVERTLNDTFAALSARLLQGLLTTTFSAAYLLSKLKVLGGRLGMRFKEYRRVRLRLSTGQEIEVMVAYFIKATPKRGRRKRGPNGRGAYLGLEVLGIIERCSPTLLSEVVSLALLCPSFEVAREVLARRGIALDVKTVRRLCQGLGGRGLGARGAVSIDADESLAGRTLVIGIDGGRLRERRRKRGRKRAGQKRQGYHTDWKEPKLFTLYVTDCEGRIIRTVKPLHDATLGDHEAMFALLEQYLRALKLSDVERLVFCGDGASWIWSDAEALVTRLGVEPTRVHHVLDYTHAKQNLNDMLDLLPSRVRTKALEQQWKHLLWQGQIDALAQAINDTFTSKTAREQALNKWHNYFAANAQRMQYQIFKEQGLPCGSGSVESAIRRVINLRLKAPGSFWTPDMAETFLFLRSQLLSGRWDVMLSNITRKMTKQIQYQIFTQDSANDDEWLKAA